MLERLRLRSQETMGKRIRCVPATALNISDGKRQLDSSLSPCSSSCESLELHRAGYLAPDHDA